MSNAFIRSRIRRRGPDERLTLSERGERGELLVLYDADCGLCTRVARLLRRLDGGRRLDPRPLQSWHDALGGPSAAELRQAIHVRDASGRWFTGGAATIRIAGEIRPLRLLATVAGTPILARRIDAIYELVARNRHRISRLLGDAACRVDRRTS